jgi:hypothetical protein
MAETFVCASNQRREIVEEHDAVPEIVAITVAKVAHDLREEAYLLISTEN